MGKQNKVPEIIQAETQFNIRLGDKVYLVDFNTKAFIRIKEARPLIPTPFDLLEYMLPYEAVPFLIDSGINPKDKTWSSFDEFLDLYEASENEDAIGKTLPAYLSACGTIAKKLQPAIEAVAALEAKNRK